MEKSNSERQKEQIRDQIHEQLAKLFSNENITVIHKPNSDTAYFNLETRELNLPDWKAGDDLWLMLLAHEVSHALHTPRNIFEDAQSDSKLRFTINVVEDCRIEKLIQRKYPGLRAAFINGYKDLHENLDGFGLSKLNLNKLSLVDRINIHAKLRSLVNVPFSNEELPLLQAVEDCKTPEDVIRVSKLLVGDYKQEQQEPQPKNPNTDKSNSEENESYNDSDDKSSASESGEGSEKEELQEGEPQPESNDESSEDAEKFGSTMANSEESLKKLSQFNHYAPTAHVKFDAPNMQNVKDYTIDKLFYAKLESDIARNKHLFLFQENTMYRKIAIDKSKALKIASQLCQVFEMKKQAQIQLRARTCKTGILNTNKLHQHLYNDDVFLKVTNLPQGKSHGLAMFVDFSGSMTDKIYGVVKQLVVLSTFCRKTNIPYRVYGFTGTDAFAPCSNKISTFSDDFHLFDLLSNEQTIAEHTKSLEILLVYSFMAKQGRRTNFMGCTPLEETILCAIPILNDLKSKYSLEQMHCIFLTDGNSSGSLYVEDYNSTTFRASGLTYKSHCHITETKSKKLWKFSKNPSIYTFPEASYMFLKIMKDMTGAKVVNFFIRTTKKSGEKPVVIEKNVNGWDVQYHINATKVDEIFDSTKFHNNADNKDALRDIRKAFTKSESSTRDEQLIAREFASFIA